MADLPNNPNNREEEYLADIAGLPNDVPENPWSRKEAYLAAISGRLDGIDERIAALSTDISLKGGVATETDLPSGAAVGDAYITEDTGVMYVWVGDDWVALGGTGINVVQSTGTSTTDVMSQNATTGMVYKDTSTLKGVQVDGQIRGSFFIQGAVAIGGRADDGGIAIGYNNNGYGANAKQSGSIAIGQNAVAGGSVSTNAVAIGGNAQATAGGAVALGRFANATTQGQMDIGVSNATWAASEGYLGTQYRLLSGVHDPVNDHDAATKGYVDAHAGGGGGATPLTSADYNYHISGTEDDTVALWKMPAGIYESYSTGVKTGMYNPQSYSANAIFVVRHPNSDLSCITAFVGSAIYPDIPSLTSYGGGVIDVLVNTTTGERITNLGTYGNSYRLLNTIEVQDNLTSTRTDIPLSANQGKVLKGLIDNLTARVTALEGQ